MPDGEVISPASQLPEDFDGKDVVARYKSWPELAKAYVHADRMASGMARIPGEGTTPEDRTAFYRKLGAPENVDGYAVPETTTDLKDTLGGLREVALSSGISKHAWDQLATKAAAGEKVKDEAYKSSLAKAKESWAVLAKERFGADHDRIVGEAQRQYDKLVQDENVRELVAALGLEGHPDFLEPFAQVAKALGPDRIPSDKGGPMESPEETPDALRKEFISIWQSEEFRNKRHVGHADALEKYLATGKKLTELGYKGINDPKFKDESKPLSTKSVLKE